MYSHNKLKFIFCCVVLDFQLSHPMSNSIEALNHELHQQLTLYLPIRNAQINRSKLQSLLPPMTHVQ